MSAETKTFPIEIALSAYTGVMLVEGVRFHELHACLDWLVGFETWTHELAREDLHWEAIKTFVDSQPALASDALKPEFDKSEGAGPIMDQIRAWLLPLVEKYGTDIELKRGTCERTKSPIATAVEMVGADRVLVAALPDAESGEEGM